MKFVGKKGGKLWFFPWDSRGCDATHRDVMRLACDGSRHYVNFKINFDKFRRRMIKNRVKVWRIEKKSIQGKYKDLVKFVIKKVKLCFSPGVLMRMIQPICDAMRLASRRDSDLSRRDGHFSADTLFLFICNFGHFFRGFQIQEESDN